MKIKFKKLDIGERFYDPNTAEDYVKVSENAAEFLVGGNYNSRQITTFEEDDFMEVTK